MTKKFKPTVPVEVAPARVAEVATTFRIRRIRIDKGSPDGSQPPAVRADVAAGTESGAVFTPLALHNHEISDPVDVAAILDVTTQGNETIDEALERLVFDWMIANGHVTSGTFEA